MELFGFGKKAARVRDAESADLTKSAAQENPMPAVLSSSEECAVSVIIPVYNTMPYLTELLNSLEVQDLDSKRFEVIAVNDGSTDYSGEILDVYAKRNANFRVVHQANSGWPGKPRNVGIDIARGEYVFFCDGDDVLGHEALRRMVDYAKKNDVDVLIPKMVGLGGRRVMAALYRTTRLDTPLDVALRSLNPIKLIRRSLMLDTGIRFKEEPVRLEDGMAVAQAYMAAKRISILTGYDFYHARSRSDGQNISIRLIEPLGYVGSLTEIARTVTENVSDETESRQLVAGLFIRKGLRFYEGQRFLAYDNEGRAQWMRAHAQFLDRFLPGETEDLFAGVHQVRVAAIRAGRLDELVLLAETELGNARKPDLVELHESGPRVRVVIRSYATDKVACDLVVEDRDTGQKTFFALQAGDEEGLLQVELSNDQLATVLDRLGNVSVAYDSGGSDMRRIAMGSDIASIEVGGVRYYRTVQGYFSVDVRQAK